MAEFSEEYHERVARGLAPAAKKYNADGIEDDSPTVAADGIIDVTPLGEKVNGIVSIGGGDRRGVKYSLPKGSSRAWPVALGSFCGAFLVGMPRPVSAACFPGDAGGFPRCPRSVAFLRLRPEFFRRLRSERPSDQWLRESRGYDRDAADETGLINPGWTRGSGRADPLVTREQSQGPRAVRFESAWRVVPSGPRVANSWASCLTCLSS